MIRPRRDEDLPACAEALRGVHENDGYPVRWPADPGRWLTPEGMLGAWIAADGPAVLGHVALTVAGEEIAEPAAELALVARLFVALEARRGGIASDLLEYAARAASGAGLQAALEVDAAAAGAVALYERAGWRFAGSGSGGWLAKDGLPARVRFYLAPTG